MQVCDEAVAEWGGNQVRRVDIVSGCFFLIDTDLWRALEGFDPAFFMYGEEADLCARARKIGAAPRMTPHATIIHYGGASATRRVDTAIYLAGARIGLAKRHLSKSGGAFSRASAIFAAAWRASIYGLLAKAGRGSRSSADLWREVWARRREWRDGPSPRAL